MRPLPPLAGWPTQNLFVNEKKDKLHKKRSMGHKKNLRARKKIR